MANTSIVVSAAGTNILVNVASGGVQAVATGGTGQSSYTDGQLLIGNSSDNGLDKGTITAGEGLDITNGNGTIRLDCEDATTINKGVAAFASGNFTVNSGDVSIKDGGVDLTTKVTGTLPKGNGGTGQTTYTNGQLLIGNTTGNTLAKGTITAGEGIDVTNGTGTIQIDCEDATSANKGVASFSTDNFAVASGDVTIKDGGVAIAEGGHGQSTKAAGFDALSPTTTEGDIIYRNGSNNVRLPKGTASQVLAMNAGATAPEWTAAATSGQVWDFLAEVTVSAGSTTEIEFLSNLWDSTHTTLVLVLDSLSPTTDNQNLYIRQKHSGAYVTAAVYHWSVVSNGAATTGTTDTKAQITSDGIGNVLGEELCGELRIHGHLSTSVGTKFDCSGAHAKADGTPVSVTSGGGLNYNAVLDGFKIYNASGAFDTGAARLYGIKNETP